MTDPRKSVAFALESGDFGSGDTVDHYENKKVFYSLPLGTWLTHSHGYKTESIYATGSKRREGAAYGQFQGDWQLNLVMDYDHTEFLDLIFDNQTKTAVTGMFEDGKQVYLHKWTKANQSFVPPFVFREKLLNRIANSNKGDDEVIITKGAIAKQAKFVRSAQDSKMNVTISGYYADIEIELADLSVTDYTTYSSPIGATQYSCMFLDSVSNDNYVRDVDSHEITIDLNPSLVFNTCSPIATTYYEGNTSIVWSAKTFSNDPRKKFQLRPFSGGVDALHNKPMTKGLMPMEAAYFVTYNLSARDLNTTIKDAIDDSPYMLEFKLIDTTVNSMTFPDGNGEKITDALQSVECTAVEISIRNTNSSGYKEWTHKIFAGTEYEGTGPGYTVKPLVEGVVKEFRPSITTTDEDILADGESTYTVQMPTGKTVKVSSTDWNTSRILIEATVGTALPAQQVTKYQGWFVVPYSLTSTGDGPVTLGSLFSGKTPTPSDTKPSGLTFTTNILAERTSSDIIDEGEPVTEVVRYLPSLVVSGTPASGTAGPYKYYIMKGYITPERKLVIEDRGMLLLTIASS